MAVPRIGLDDLGAYYLRESDGSVFRLTGFADRPTATLERLYALAETGSPASALADDFAVLTDALRTYTPQDSTEWAPVWQALERIRAVVASFGDRPERIGGVVGATIFDGLVRLAESP